MSGGRIPFEEAARMFFAHAFSRMPPEIAEELQRKILTQFQPKLPGLTWWADQTLMVHEQDGEFVVERADVEGIIARVVPYQWPPA